LTSFSVRYSRRSGWSLEGEIELVAHLIAHDPADADAAGRGQSFQSRDVHAVSKNVSALGDDITEVDPDAELDPLVRRESRIALGHFALDICRKAHSVNHAGELGQKAVASPLDCPAPVLGNLRLNQLPELRFQPLVRSLLVCSHQARIACHIGGQDRSEAPGPAQVSRQPALRRPSSM
jgi:hypothetical protein